MQTQLEEKLKTIKTEVERYEKAIQKDMNYFVEMTDTTRWGDRIKETFTRLAHDKRAIFAVLGMAISVILVRELLHTRARRRNAREEMDESYAPVPMRTRNSFLMDLVIMAMRAFALHYARKLLIQYLEQTDSPVEAEPLVKEN